MYRNPLVIDNVVQNDLCIGCGVCVQACPNGVLTVDWNDYGFLVAGAINDECCNAGACLKVCPFNPEVDSFKFNENNLAINFLGDSKSENKKIGRYNEIYVGFSKKNRLTSSSGGIATYIFEQLLRQKIVDHVVAVSYGDSSLYKYTIISDPCELDSSSKTRYYPVSLSEVLKEVKKLNGTVAISGVGCFVKSIRLAQLNDTHLRDKIKFVVGIICGGVKSKFFTEYLASRAGVSINDVISPEYRVKDYCSKASDYSFSCNSAATGKIHSIKMSSIGDMWGTGLFKANACDFCDDVTTELADVSLGDAWMEPFSNDGYGHNVVVARSGLADSLIINGDKLKELDVSVLEINKFIKSQQGSFNHRHDGLFTRIKIAKKHNKIFPQKRFGKIIQPLHVELVQLLRLKIRAMSLEYWKSANNAKEFDKKILLWIFLLRFATRMSRVIKKISRDRTVK